MAEIQKIKSLITKLGALAVNAIKSDNVAVAVGYTAQYAIFVHEDLEAKHTVGQAKYLEQPARTLRNSLVYIVLSVLKAGKTMALALLTAGLRLQRESQKLVPVDTGNLKNSAFTKLVKGEE